VFLLSLISEPLTPSGVNKNAVPVIYSSVVGLISLCEEQVSECALIISFDNIAK
jgi:hypothetical protein